LVTWTCDYDSMTKKFYSTVLVQLVAGCVLALGALAQTEPTLHPLELDYVAPASYLIQEIQVTGTKSIDKEAVLSFLGLQSGDTVQIPGPAIADAIQKLWKQELVKDVAIYASRITEHQIVLTVSITECPTLSDYFFEGIKRKEQEKLIEKIDRIKGKIVTEKLIKSTQKTVKDYWEEKGYLHTTVTVDPIPDPMRADHVKLRIKVDKGAKLSINAVHFEGNEHISSALLKSQMRHIREKPRFTLVKDALARVLTLQPIGKDGVIWRPFNLKESINYFQEHVILLPSRFNKVNFEEDKKRIISYYQSKGFRDAAIVEDTVYEPEDALLNVCIKIEEGRQYRVGDIKWVGNYLYDDNTLNKVLNIQRGDVYNSSLLWQRLYRNPEGPDIASLYVDNGYFFFQANLVEVGLEGDTIDLELHLQEGSQVHINKIFIEGNRLTHDHVIRRELRTLPGDKFSRAKMERSDRELTQLNLFGPAIDILPVPNLIDKTVDIKYKVEDRPKFEIRFSGGWGGEFIGELCLATNNFSLGNLFKSRAPVGGGQTLRLSVETNGEGYKNFALQFTDPWLGGRKPRQFSLGVNRSSEDNRSTVCGKVGLGTRLTWPDDYTVLRGGLTVCRHNYKDYDLLGNDEKCTDSLNDLSIDISIERDSTDSPLYPKEGSKLVLHTSLTPPWSWFSTSELYRWKEYHQWMLDGSYFFRLLEDLVLNVRGHFGMLGKFPSQKRIGPFERFYLGGSNGLEKRALIGKEHISLRGYEEEYITPKDKVTGYKGGVIYDKFVLELRYPIISSRVASAYALAFAEGGNAWAQYEDFNPFALNRSAGVGIRVYLPFIIGTTIGLDWGYGFDKKPTDKKYNELAFHFSIGMGLR
jgi:outer membrane protein insertion porin family